MASNNDIRDGHLPGDPRDIRQSFTDKVPTHSWRRQQIARIHTNAKVKNGNSLQKNNYIDPNIPQMLNNEHNSTTDATQVFDKNSADKDGFGERQRWQTTDADSATNDQDIL